MIISGAFLCCFFRFGQTAHHIFVQGRDVGKIPFLRRLHHAAHVRVPPYPIGAELHRKGAESVHKLHDIHVRNGFGDILLPKYMGLYSVAMATALSQILSSALNLAALKKHTGFRQYFARTLILVGLLCLPCAYFAYSVSRDYVKILGAFRLAFGAARRGGHVRGIVRLDRACGHKSLLETENGEQIRNYLK